MNYLKIHHKVGDYVLVSHPDNKLPSKLDTKWYGPKLNINRFRPWAKVEKSRSC